MEGFTYNGIHCSTYNVGYIPDASDRWWEDADFEIYQKDVSWRNGGYYYGSAVKIRPVEIKCYYEEITTATREKIRQWLARGTHGRLIFDERPFVYYDVRPQSVVTGSKYLDTNETYSGTFTIKFTLENPFGVLTRKSNDGTEDDNAEDYCGIIQTDMMPSPPSTSSYQFDVYNPGTESCGMSVKIAGTTTNDFRLYNTSNGSSCVISSLPSSLVLDINGETGNIITYPSSTPSLNEPGFAYHDYGIVRLDPNESQSDILYTAEENGTSYNVIPINYAVSESMVGGVLHLSSGGGHITIVDTQDGRGGTVREVVTDSSVTITSTPDAGGGTVVTVTSPDDPLVVVELRVVSVNVESNTLTCTKVSGENVPLYGNMNISTVNHIVIEEKNSSGNWVTPTTLSMTLIDVDYVPRLQ